MRNNLGIMLAGALVLGLSAPVQAGVGSEEDAAAPAGSFVSTMADPGAVPAKAVQAIAAVKTVRLARASAK